MKAEIVKLSFIERLMRVQKASTLKRKEQLITQAEMESRAEESIEAISKEEVIPLDEFEKENREWMKKNYTRY